MKFLKFAMAIALLPLLAACAAGPNTDATMKMANKGSAFDKALQAEYVVLAVAEAKEWDTEDANYFNNKAITAANGEDVQPQAVDERTIVGDVKWELEAARQALRAELLGGSKEWAPAESARAQAMFDCWLQEEEDGPKKDADACKAAFNEALNKIPGMRPAMMMKAMPKATKMPGPFVVYFDFDSFDLSATGEAVVKEAAEAAQAAGASKVIVIGHTDKAGSDEYNAGLSRARAASIGNQLMLNGVARDMVERSAAGESFPEKATADGMKEPLNRRVVISLTR
tara:strand:+ start:1984 stop:2835 length:852 start_codon:yes stop_codon:yes gene_type:complete